MASRKPDAYALFRNRMIDFAWRQPDEKAVLNEIRWHASNGRQDEAHILAGLWYDANVDALCDAWSESTMPGMKRNQELNDRRFKLRKKLMDDLKAKLDGSKYVELCNAIHPKML
jgi:hypothetical protein